MHHKTCIVDALGRAGKLKEAEELLAEIASPDVVVYLSLLGACKNLKNLEYGMPATFLSKNSNYEIFPKFHEHFRKIKS